MDKKSIATFSLVLTAFLVSLSFCVDDAAADDLADSPQPKFQHDLSNTGQSQYVGLQTNDTKWKVKINGTSPPIGSGPSIISSPAIGPDGTIYIGWGDNYLYGPSIDGGLYALNPDGTVKWYYRTGNWIDESSPAISSDGTIYFGGVDGILYALKSDGTLKWRFETDSSILSSPP